MIPLTLHHRTAMHNDCFVVTWARAVRERRTRRGGNCGGMSWFTDGVLGYDRGSAGVEPTPQRWAWPVRHGVAPVLRHRPL